jgi:hypothetical protein
MKKLLLAATITGALTLGMTTNSYADMDLAMGMLTGISNGTAMGNIGAMLHNANDDDNQSSSTSSNNQKKSTPVQAQNVHVDPPIIEEKKENESPLIKILALLSVGVLGFGIYKLIIKN